MSQRLLERIRDAIARGDYDLTRHAVDEMAEDDFAIHDIEYAVLDGEIVKTETDDPRGPRYTIIGLAEDGKNRGRRGGSLHRDRHLSHHYGIRGHRAGGIECTDTNASTAMVRSESES